MLNAAVPAECYDLNATREQETRPNASVGGDANESIARLGYRGCFLNFEFDSDASNSYGYKGKFTTKFPETKISNFYFSEDSALKALKDQQNNRAKGLVCYMPEKGVFYFKGRGDWHYDFLSIHVLTALMERTFTALSDIVTWTYNFFTGEKEKGEQITDYKIIRAFGDTSNSQFAVGQVFIQGVQNFEIKTHNTGALNYKDHSSWHYDNFYQTRQLFNDMKNKGLK